MSAGVRGLGVKTQQWEIRADGYSGAERVLRQSNDGWEGADR